jgi:hypothetical protein
VNEVFTSLVVLLLLEKVKSAKNHFFHIRQHSDANHRFLARKRFNELERSL